MTIGLQIVLGLLFGAGACIGWGFASAAHLRLVLWRSRRRIPGGGSLIDLRRYDAILKEYYPPIDPSVKRGPFVVPVTRPEIDDTP